MNKLRTLLTLLVVSICAVQSAWADRSAPELPTAVAPVSGQSYYLYNVMEQKFLCRSTTSTSYAAIGTYGDKITITATANGNEYTIQWASDNYYFFANDSYVNSWLSKNNNNDLFTIAQSAKGYTIQRSPSNTSYYKADEYIGYNGNNGDRLNPALPEGSIHWKFLPVDEAEHYMAKHKLYTYLNTADSYNFYITQYDNIYNDPASTTEQLNQAQETLNNALTISTNFVSPDWTDYPILLQNGTANKWKISSGRLIWQEYVSGAANLTSQLTGTVNVDEPVTLVYKWEGNTYTNLRVYLDGEMVQTVASNVSNGDARRYYIELPTGNHNITWEAVLNITNGNYNSYTSVLREIGIEITPTWTPATTTVEGQLGTEILKLTDNIANVRKIVINGVIGADDWTTIGMMKNAFTIDMSGATATAGIPGSLFRNSKMPFLHSIKLPQGLTTIGEYAFDGSDIDDVITFPNTLQSIGYDAFQKSKIKGAYMPNSVTSIGSEAFRNCKWLENASWSSAAATIERFCFQECVNLRTFEIPEGVTTIRWSAFYGATNFNPRFPSTLTRIEDYAFYNSGIDELVIPESVTFIGGYAFAYCNNLVSVTLPTSYYKITYGNNIGSFVGNCPMLKDVYFKSPTVMNRDGIDFFNGCTAEGLTLHVPSFLVSAYKLDPYWYNYNPTGFSTTEITDWIVRGNVTLNAGERIEGTPNVTMREGATLTINGDDAMALNNFQTDVDGTRTDQNRTKIIGNTNNISITGNYTYRYYTYANRWYFITLPFDVNVSNITSPGCSKAVRYYDGATRAANGTGSNWKNYAADDVIPAGTGFIYQTSADCWSEFVAEDNAAKNYVFSKNEFVKSLAAHLSEVTANKGWNLVGNPWLCYYNIHKLNFTAPITVWNDNNYTAYSIIDDNYAILPGQAFFVQCPDEVNSISFPIDGRQMTPDIENHNAARQYGEYVATKRKLIDIELTAGEQSDKTRFVLNPQAKKDYETSRDASKFFSMDGSMPQIYTIENGTQMAINERPAGDGIVKIGLLIPTNGNYTLKSERNQLTDAVLVDLQNGVQTNLSTDSYTFNAEAGTLTNRFELHLSAGDVTGIKTLSTPNADGEKVYYNLNGQRIEKPTKGIYVVNGKKVINK